MKGCGAPNAQLKTAFSKPRFPLISYNPRNHIYSLQLLEQQLICVRHINQ